MRVLTPEENFLWQRRIPLPGKLRLVIDSDAKNEVDDQFAISWALRSPERFQVEAVYAVPFSHTSYRHNLGQKDYQDGSVHNTVTGADSAMELSGSNVLRYELEDGTSFIIRPSGTEPKIKVYILTSDSTMETADAKVARYAEFAETIKNV